MLGLRLAGVSLVLALFGCGDDGPGGGSAGGPDDGLPELPADRTGAFADGGLQLDIELSSVSHTQGCPNDATQCALLANDGISVQLEDASFNDVPITRVTVTADGVPVPMELSESGWRSAYEESQPIAARYVFEIEAGAGNTLSNLVYETKYLQPHTITQPAPDSVLTVGQDVEVAWTPSDPRLAFQVDLSYQSFDATYMGGDPGAYTLPGSALTSAQDVDELRVGRRAYLAIQGLSASGVRHTHRAEIQVRVAAP